MHSLYFWRNWSIPYRVMWYFLAAIFLVSVGLTWLYYFKGAGSVIDWERIQEQKVIETTIHQFRLGPFQLNIPAESYVIFEYFGGSDVQHNLAVSYCFVVVLLIAALWLFSIITTLEGFGYFVGVGLFIAFFISLRLEVLQLFGLKGLLVPLVLLAVFVGVSFYFRYFRMTAGFATRLLTFLGLGILMLLAIILYSEASLPLLHVMTTSYVAAMIITVIFIILVAHEIMVGFVYITEQAREGANAKHFTIISLFYIVNVILTVLHELGTIQWDFIYLNIYLLLTISALLGVWGYRIREPQYENLYAFEPFGAFVFVALGTISFMTIAQLLGNGNDAALRVIRDLTIFTHAGFGIVFFIYFFSNFLVMMGEKIPVYRVLYKPNRMPYFTFRLMGIITTLAFVFYAHWRDYPLHATAGFYNYIGDLYRLQGNEIFAQSFYEQSANRAFQNHRANYELGNIRTSRIDFEKAERNYRFANGKRPTEYSLANAANLYFIQRRYFDAIKDLEKAVTIMPSSPAIKNNLGYAYAKVHNLDSANHYLNEARKSNLTRASAEGNFLAMAASEYIPVEADSVLQSFDRASSIVTANAIAVATLFNQKITTTVDPLAVRELDLYSATLLNNHIVKNAKTLDTAFVRRALIIADDSLNYNYQEALKSSLAYACYHQGKVFQAIDIMSGLTYVTQNYKGKYNYIMGLWALEQGNPEEAARYFSFAQSADYKNGKFYYAIALTEAGTPGVALAAWDSVTSEDPAIRRVAEDVTRILRMRDQEVLTLSDAQKYQFCRYRIGLRDTTLFNRIAATFTNPNYKAKALLDMATKFYRADRLATAIRYLNRTTGTEITDRALFEDLQHLELAMLGSRKELATLALQINKGVSFGGERILYQLWYQALLNEDSDKEIARRNYEFLANANPFFEEGILGAAEYFRNQDPQSMKAYNTLAEAIHVNDNSLRLLKAYAGEAARLGFSEFASSAARRVVALEAGLNQ